MTEYEDVRRIRASRFEIPEKYHRGLWYFAFIVWAAAVYELVRW